MYPLKSYLSEHMQHQYRLLSSHPTTNEQCFDCNLIRYAINSCSVHDYFTKPDILVHLIHISDDLCDCVNDNVNYNFDWTLEPELFELCFNLCLNSFDQINNYTGALLLCGLLERLLGNLIFSNSANNVPNMMSLVVHHDVIRQLLGVELQSILVSLFGGPSTYNFRNLIWHGFMKPSELDRRILKVIFYLIDLIRKKTNGLQITQRPCRIMPIPDKILQDVDEFNVLDVTDYIDNCMFLLDNDFAQILRAAFDAYSKQNWIRSAFLIFPVIEHAVRSLYCINNKYADRQVSSESDGVKYITLDTMLMNTNDDCFRLNICVEQLLLDLLHHMYGPQLRNRISHGEVSASTYEIMLSWSLSAVVRCTLYSVQTLQSSLKHDTALLSDHRVLIHSTYRCLFSNKNVSKIFLDNAINAVDSWKHIVDLQRVDHTFEEVDKHLNLHKLFISTFIYRDFLPNKMTAAIQLTDIIMCSLEICKHFDEQRIYSEEITNKISSRKNKNLQSYKLSRDLIQDAFLRILNMGDIEMALRDCKHIYKYIRIHKWLELMPVIMKKYPTIKAF
ncbi:hypothetical protein GJ496_010364 [Pomphorhynchus laevis]|nr:hypothetical protein GJ496_010364 [Pomphorhynchus laevis]